MPTLNQESFLEMFLAEILLLYLEWLAEHFSRT
jgi:hypothetical protein